MTARQTGLTSCPACGRLHLLTSMVRDPDRPHRLLCPVKEARGVMRLTLRERTESTRLLRSAFGDKSAPGHEFPADDEISWPADDWWTS